MRDYWSFPAVHETFVKRTCGVVRRCELGGLYRLDRGKLLVIVPPRGWDFSALFKEVGPVPAHLIRSFPYTEVPPHVVSYAAGVCYAADRCWSPSKDGAYSLRRGARECTVVDLTLHREDLPGLVADWARWAQERHDMVVKGHYLRMIDDPRFNFLGFLSSGKLVAATGFVVDGSEAAVTFVKHHKGPWWLATYIWTYTVQEVLRRGAESINCGDTADGLKTSVGLTPVKQRRLYYSKKGLYHEHTPHR